jgi:hypothetical protein
MNGFKRVWTKRGWAEERVITLLTQGGWQVRKPVPALERGADLLASRDGTRYTIAIKSASEGRSDRLVPLWSQAYLEAVHAAIDPRHVIVVVAAPKVSPRVATQVLEFAASHAPNAIAGVVDGANLRWFHGESLEGLTSEPPARRTSANPFTRNHTNLFSDLNQWMLKVLLAPEIPEQMLAAPRARYQNATQLAAAANVSVMSASRLVRQLERDGFLHENSPYLELVRREELFRDWQNRAAKRTREIPLRFLPGGATTTNLDRMTSVGEACLALFSAADALGVGFVRGVAPCLYVRRLGPATLTALGNGILAKPDETPDLIVREAPAPESVFRGAVQTKHGFSCDVLQVWLDVANHPSRGAEQAGLIRDHALSGLFKLREP